MAINSHLFQASAVLYYACLTHATNLLPSDPQHAARAKMIADRLYQATGENGVLTLAAAHAMAGFMRNKQSGHGSDEELINLSMTGIAHLANAFKQPEFVAPVPHARRVVTRPANPAPTMPHQMPTTAVQFTPVAPPPPPLEIPDFTDERQEPRQESES